MVFLVMRKSFGSLAFSSSSYIWRSLWVFRISLVEGIRRVVPPNTIRSFFVDSSPKSLQNSAIRDFGYSLDNLVRSKFISQHPLCIEFGTQLNQNIIHKELGIPLPDLVAAKLFQDFPLFRE